MVFYARKRDPVKANVRANLPPGPVRLSQRHHNKAQADRFIVQQMKPATIVERTNDQDLTKGLLEHPLFDILPMFVWTWLRQ